MMHELRRLAPALMFEQHDGVVVLLAKIEADLGADPVLGAGDHFPGSVPLGTECKHLHVEAALPAEAEFNDGADLALAGRRGGPPGGETVNGGQRMINLARRRLDAYA